MVSRVFLACNPQANADDSLNEPNMELHHGLPAASAPLVLALQCDNTLPSPLNQSGGLVLHRTTACFSLHLSPRKQHACNSRRPDNQFWTQPSSLSSLSYHMSGLPQACKTRQAEGEAPLMSVLPSCASTCRLRGWNHRQSIQVMPCLNEQILHTGSCPAGLDVGTAHVQMPSSMHHVLSHTCPYLQLGLGVLRQWSIIRTDS